MRHRNKETKNNKTRKYVVDLKKSKIVYRSAMGSDVETLDRASRHIQILVQHCGDSGRYTIVDKSEIHFDEQNHPTFLTGALKDLNENPAPRHDENISEFIETDEQ